MIINNKYLNSKPVYGIPEGVKIEEYRSYYKREPSFIPDICINKRGTVGVRSYKETAMQVCIKTSDSMLLKYLKEYDWCGVFNRGSSIVGASKCTKCDVEKIISEYYSGIK